MREKAAAENDLLQRLAGDERLRLSRAEVEALVADPASFVGAASAQVKAVVDRVAEVVDRHPGAAAYAPPPIL
jgi:adenylosuccinate lyase